MIRFILIFIYIGFIPMFAKEIFGIDTIKQYLTNDNPYVYVSLGKKYINEEKLQYALGNYDTKIVAKYEDKEYARSNAKYYKVGLEKPLVNGVDIDLSYRYAEGTQEYNNIKTSEDGEMVLGVKVPVLNVINKIDKRRLDAGLASMNIDETEFKFKDSMRNLYFKIMINYYELIYAKRIVDISKNLLSKSQLRYDFLQKKVEQGSIPKMDLIEIQQQLINREQILLSADTQYDNQLTDFLRFLNISQDEFEEMYKLADSLDLQMYDINYNSAIDTALQNRPDLKFFDNEIKKLNLKQKYNDILKYPSLDVGLYGVYDMKDDYQNNDQMGYKVMLSMNFPIEQTKYSSKNMQNRHSMTLVDASKNRLLIELRNNLQNIITSLNALRINIENSNKEVVLVEKLQKLEQRKYELGSSTLFMLNQREMQVLNTQKKLLKFKLDYVQLHQRYMREINLYPL